ncbi:hypothetical protein XELAEV_18006763mg [Xenopus laevis]|uniref:Uncharacterized protein n=1 Tax=Xenopus laevis TaxID=8355 RepID=A0A974I3U0_XENLA|nr:hypothetical protein XELAEV_18006763mg [Xenopus laevis]
MQMSFIKQEKLELPASLYCELSHCLYSALLFPSNNSVLLTVSCISLTSSTKIKIFHIFCLIHVHNALHFHTAYLYAC